MFGIPVLGIVIFIVLLESLLFLWFSLQILQDWISLIDEDGWVAREQILGDEARSRVS